MQAFRHFLLPGAQEGDDVVGFDDAYETAVGVNDGQSAQVVLVEEFGDVVLVLFGAGADEAHVGEDFEAGFGAGQDETRQRHNTAQDF